MKMFSKGASSAAGWLSAVVLCFFPLIINATSGCYQWYYHWLGFNSPLFDSPQEACELWWSRYDPGPLFTKDHYTVQAGGFPGYLCVAYYTRLSDGQQTHTGTNLSNTTAPGGCQQYVSARLDRDEHSGSCDQNSVGDPIDPATATVFDTVEDCKATGTTAFQRFYNSKDDGFEHIAVGWRHAYSRSIRPSYGRIQYRPYEVHLDNSSTYGGEAIACTSGFAQVKSRVSTWANATASYSNGVCRLNVGTQDIGSLTIYYTSPPTPDPATRVVVGFDAIRDDGKVLNFLLDGGAIKPPPGTRFRLEQTAGGYRITDSADNVELYDSEGKLLSITSSAGVIQTMSYDNAGRLLAVSDAFGHGIILTYDNVGRVSAVTRQ